MTARPAIFAFLLLTVLPVTSRADDRWVLGSLFGGYANDLVYDPAQPSIVYAGSGAGLFRSTNSGGSWTLVADVQGVSVFDVEISSADPNRVYVATNRGTYRSTDRGLTFTLRSEDLWTSFEVSQVDADHLYGLHGAEVRKSTNGGASWGPPGTGLPGSQLSDIAIAATNPDTVYAGNYQGTIYKTTNGGASWQPAGSGLPGAAIASLEVDPTNASIAYAGLSGSTVYKTVTGGAGWSPLTTGLLQGMNYQALSISRTAPQTILAGSNFGVYLTTNGGTNWTVLPGMTGVFSTAVAIDPVERSRMVFQARDTLYRTTDLGTTSAASATGYTSVVMQSVALHPVDAKTIYASTGGGLFRSTDGARTWTELGDIQYAYVVLVNPLTPTTLYVASGGTLLRSTDNGATFGQWAEGLPGSAAVDLAFDEQTGTVYAATSNRKIFKRSGASPWTDITNGMNAGSMQFVTVDPSGAGVLYAGGGSASLYRSVNSGGSWEPLPFEEWVEDLHVDPFDSRHLLAETSGAIWESRDTGATWSQTTYDRGVAFDPSRPGVIWGVGSEVTATTAGHRSRVGNSLGHWVLEEVHVSREGDVFVTTDPGGVFLLDEQPRRRAVRR